MWTNLVSRAHSSQTADSHDCDRSQSGRALSPRMRRSRRCSPTLRSSNAICWHRRWWHFSRHGRTIRTWSPFLSLSLFSLFYEWFSFLYCLGSWFVCMFYAARNRFATTATLTSATQHATRTSGSLLSAFLERQTYHVVSIRLDGSTLTP